MSQLTVIVEEENLQQRIDQYLVKVLKQESYSRSKIQRLITLGKILVNNEVITSKYQVKFGDEIIIQDNPAARWTINNDLKDAKLDIIYEDDAILVINKPKGLVVHPAAGNWDNTLVNILLAQNKKLSLADDKIRPGIVHRLDKDTTGLIIIAKDDESHRILSAQLQNKTLTRKYFALVHGIITTKDNLVDGPIGRDPKNRKKMAIVFNNSRHAQTKFSVLTTFVEDNMSLIECTLLTGRTHQIRVHLSSIKHPIVGDHVYGTRKDLDEPYKQYLHAHEIILTHPKTKAVMTFNSELPLKFKAKLASLK